jgi:hypothetical protein
MGDGKEEETPLTPSSSPLEGGPGGVASPLHPPLRGVGGVNTESMVLFPRP